MSFLINRYFLIVSYILIGVVSYYKNKLQNIENVEQSGHTKKFYHPYMQALIMFIGQFLCLGMFLIYKIKNKDQIQKNKQQALAQGKIQLTNKFILLLPSLIDLCGSFMNIVAINFVIGSVNQMLGGGSVITTLIFTKILLKININKNQILACVLAMIGMIIIGTADLIINKSVLNISFGLQIFGYVMNVLSLVFFGLYFAIEQKILTKYYIQPLEMVGYEGLFGVIISCILISIVTFIPCPFGESACVYRGGKLFFESPQVYFSEILNNNALLIIIILGMISISFYNLNGLLITKYTDATNRALLGLVKIIMVWIIGFIVTKTAGKHNDKYKWESSNIYSILLEFVGFIFLSAGSILYYKSINLQLESIPTYNKSSLLTESNQQEFK